MMRGRRLAGFHASNVDSFFTEKQVNPTGKCDEYSVGLRQPPICPQCSLQGGIVVEKAFFSENGSAHKRAHSGNWLSRILNFKGWKGRKETQKGLLSAFLQVSASKLAYYLLPITYYLAFIANFGAITSNLTLKRQNLHFSFTEDVVGVVFS